MGTLHRLVLDVGRDEALKRVEPEDRHLVRVAANVLAEEAEGIGVTYSGFCQASLPHKRLKPEEPWVRRSDRIALMVEPGRLLRPGTAEPTLVGVPYGSRARLILLYLQTRAVRTKSRDVELGRSMREWLRRMGIPHGGKSYAEVKDQATRLSTCKLTFYYAAAADRTGFSNERIVDDGLMMLEDDEHDGPFQNIGASIEAWTLGPLMMAFAGRPELKNLVFDRLVSITSSDGHQLEAGRLLERLHEGVIELGEPGANRAAIRNRLVQEVGVEWVVARTRPVAPGTGPA